MCSRDHQLSELPIPIIHSGVLINRIQNIILYNFQLKLAMSHNNVCWSNLNLLLIIPILASIIFGYPNILAAHAFSSTIESIPINSSKSSPSTENKSTALIPNFSEFRGLNRNFSLLYPSDWMLEPQTSVTEQVALQITSPNGVKGGVIKFGYASIDRPLLDVIKKNHIKQEEIEQNIIFLFPLFLDNFGKTLNNYGHVQKPNYVKYLLDGHKTGSAIFNFNENDNDLAGLLIWTVVGKIQYWFVYGSSQDSFDQKFPLAEKVLNSIKLPSQLTS